MTVLHGLINNPYYFYPLVVVVALCVGSFLNVVAYRLPRMMEQDWRCQCEDLLEVPQEQRAMPTPMTLSRPRSTCPHCGHGITAMENIPVISYLLLRGKCSACQGRISPRYPSVEATTALLALATVMIRGNDTGTLLSLLLVFALIALTLIDYDTQLLPDSITLPFLWLGLVVNYFGMITDFKSAFWGAVAGYLILWSIYHLFRLLTGKHGMGYGDFKLLAALGAWMGWQYLPVIILLSSLVGAVVGIALIVFAGRDRQIPIPFGPYLAAAGVLALWWGPALNHWWLGMMGPHY